MTQTKGDKMKTFKFKDGELTVNDSGNTIIGQLAHKLYYLSAQLANKHESVGGTFDARRQAFLITLAEETEKLEAESLKQAEK